MKRGNVSQPHTPSSVPSTPRRKGTFTGATVGLTLGKITVSNSLSCDGKRGEDQESNWGAGLQVTISREWPSGLLGGLDLTYLVHRPDGMLSCSVDKNSTLVTRWRMVYDGGMFSSFMLEPRVGFTVGPFWIMGGVALYASNLPAEEIKQQPLPNQASVAQQPAQNEQAVASSPQKISEGYRYGWAPFAGAELYLGKAFLGGRVYWAGYSIDLSNIALSGLLSAYVAQQKYLLYLHYKLG